MFEVHSDPAADIGLHLAQAPIRPVWMPNQHSRLQHCIQIFHVHTFRERHRMTTASQDIPALLGSRICHDLISPIGAISNGVELLQMAGGTMSPEMELISESVANANARIKFFRVAFGAASAGQMIGATEIRSILDDLTRGSRLRIDWRAAGEQLRQEVKLAFLMLQCLETAMPWGGQITVAKEDGQWTISGTSDRMKIDAELWQALAEPGGGAEIGAAEVQFLLLPLLLAATGRRLMLELSETGAVARF